jgi:hypothetical protein
MRLAWLLTIAALGGTAHADKKIQDLKPDFVHEVAGCQVQASGITKVLAGATELAKTAEPAETAELEADVDQLTQGLARVKEHCDEVAAMVAFLDASAAASYRSVEREIDTRYNKIVKLRAASKKTVEELQPTTRKLIPRITRRPESAAPEPRRIPGKFPSGRSVDLPVLAGTWQLSGSKAIDTADYREAPPKQPAITASATTRPFSGGTCDEQRKAIGLRAGAEPVVDLDLAGAKQLGVAWGVRYTRREPTTAHLVSVLCVPGQDGGLLATADVVPAERSALADELAALLLRMLAAQKP